jgi:hypothetical protein
MATRPRSRTASQSAEEQSESDDLGYTLALVEAPFGQLYLVTVVALLVSNMGRARRDPLTSLADYTITAAAAAASTSASAPPAVRRRRMTITATAPTTT